MAVRSVVLYLEDEAALRERSEPVRRMTWRARRLMQDLKDTLNDHPSGAGLAAPQIGEHRRVVVVRLGGGQDDEEKRRKPDLPIALINPQIMETGDERRDFDGCLSFPGLYGETVRPHHLRVTGLDERGRSLDWILEGFDAVVVHHEIDHLDGVLFIDRVENMEDLYRVCEGDDGEPVRVPVSIPVPPRFSH